MSPVSFYVVIDIYIAIRYYRSYIASWYNHRYLPQFSWSETDQSIILGAFFYGYCSSQILGGYLATVYGAKLVMGYSLLATSVLALLTPVATVQSYYLLVACRVVQGLGQVMR
ncbi:glycerol-3-phosphate transporter [Elysia marginata]|uniref:Glycerol-3-phosphate transporter n=1 Tax=Elysia marginata TaxID=1093978 RepID=A0AAV4FCP5_9GAST|nr:glycerol-3-phosphate transporter [Elysia marginata]